MDDDYQVEEYFKPEVKKSTYDKNDDHYISEQDEKSEKSESESEVDDSEYKIDSKPENSTIEKKPRKQKPGNEIPRSSGRLILHVSNLSDETTKQMLEIFFNDSGQNNIKSIRIPKRKRLVRIAFVEMLDLESYKVSFSLARMTKIPYWFVAEWTEAKWNGTG